MMIKRMVMIIFEGHSLSWSCPNARRGDEISQAVQIADWVTGKTSKEVNRVNQRKY